VNRIGKVENRVPGSEDKLEERDQIVTDHEKNEKI
jgi:hypothetical protein